jgi:hypothetical protein
VLSIRQVRFQLELNNMEMMRQFAARVSCWVICGRSLHK